MGYLTQEPDPGCIFCDKPKENSDEKNLILFRGRESFVIMNLYPYSNGHLMIVPYLHTADVDEIPPSAALEMFELLKRCRFALSECMRPQGFNVGINMGRVAGAGIHEHVHTHIVPRWNGDTNFMPILAETKVISENITDSYRRLYPIFNDLHRA
jgi:ATP adenylyltransferase